MKLKYHQGVQFIWRDFQSIVLVLWCFMLLWLTLTWLISVLLSHSKKLLPVYKLLASLVNSAWSVPNSKNTTRAERWWTLLSIKTVMEQVVFLWSWLSQNIVNTGFLFESKWWCCCFYQLGIKLSKQFLSFSLEVNMEKNIIPR